MDQQTDKQEPSSKEGGEMKVGDTVWVRAIIEGFAVGGVRVQGLCGGGFWTVASDCRPVEPPVVKDPLTTKPNCPEIPDSSSEPMRDAFERLLLRLKPIERADLARNETGYFHPEIEMAWQAFQAGVKYQSSPLAPSPCMDGIKVGDAVRFVSPGHKRHGTEGVLKSIHHGPKNAYFFISNCGQFHRYCTASELELITKRHRTPTLADLANGPIECEYRDSDEEHWRSGFLVHILNGAIPFLCVNQEQEWSNQWDQCRIEVCE
jgi:hypothetical protein